MLDSDFRDLTIVSWLKENPASTLCIISSESNQIYLVTLRNTQLKQASFLQKKKNVAKWFFDIFNAEIAQCRQKLDVILGTKVVQF